MRSIKILPIGRVETELLKELKQVLPFNITILPSLEIPIGAYNKARDQYLGLAFLSCLHKFGGIVLGITSVDLYAEGLNFIFGQAELNGSKGIISTYRLHSLNKKKFISRVVKELVHELGHIFGLEHCSRELCVMRFSNCIEDTDRKSSWYCNKCLEKAKIYLN
jgi:archaemetzincin